jgi:glycosyltransferase involved in cell wall biosynthesis
VRISLIAICYNQPQQILQLLASLHTQAGYAASLEVIVIDDGSSPPVAVENTRQDAFELKHQYIARTEDSCRARARNAGARLATGDYLIFVDGDSALNPSFIKRYEHYLSVHKTREAVLGTRKELTLPDHQLLVPLLKDKTALDEFFGERGTTDGRLAYLQKVSQPLHQIPGHWAFFTSCNFCIKRTTFEAIGGFNELFKGWGSEDTEFGYRLTKAGIKYDLLNNPVAHLRASVNKSNNYPLQYNEWLRNVGIFYSIHRDEAILFLMKFEELVHRCFFRGQGWDAELHLSSFEEFSERCRMLSQQPLSATRPARS